MGSIVFSNGSFQKLTHLEFKGVDKFEKFVVGRDSLTTLPKLVLSSTSSSFLSCSDFPALRSVIVSERSLIEAEFELSNSPVQTLSVYEHAFSVSSRLLLASILSFFSSH